MSVAVLDDEGFGVFEDIVNLCLYILSPGRLV